MSVGPEVFVTADTTELKPTEGTKIKLVHPDDSVRIPSGQFALILTEEWIEIPKDVLGFISIRTGRKMEGLVNVSGFHVDPGYRGKLIFSVYNAGPSEITLSRGDDIFLLFLANLGIEDENAKEEEGYREIPSKLISSLSGSYVSPASISRELINLRKDHDVLVSTLKYALALVPTVILIALAAARLIFID